MSETHSSAPRDDVLVAAAISDAVTMMPRPSYAAPDDGAIRLFQVRVPNEMLPDLRRRIAATKWPKQEMVADVSQGMQFATMHELAPYWENDQDWRRDEARLNA